MINKLINAINSAKSIALISHISPDGDTCGSSLALYHAFELLGKSPKIFCDDKLSNNLNSLPFNENYLQESNSSFDLVIAVDCGDFSRLGQCVKIFNNASITANVDHHKSNENFADINIIDPKASATAEIIYDILSKINETKTCIDNDVAKLLYTAIITDSGGFTFSNVSSKTHYIASQLIKYDIKASEICEIFLKNIDINVFRLKNAVLSQAKFFENNKIGLIYFSKELFDSTNTNESNTVGIINNIRNIVGVEIAVSIAQIDHSNSYKISIRTSDNVDASRIAMFFGGGGHKNASGFRLNGFYEDIKDKILKVCRDYL